MFEETLCSFQVSILSARAGAETEAVSFLFLLFLFGFLKITGLCIQAVFQNWVPRLGFRARDSSTPTWEGLGERKAEGLGGG